jgi:hypothetical protein
VIDSDTLTKSLSGFAAYARQKGLIISTSEVIDGVSACSMLTPSSLLEMKDILQPCLVKDAADLQKYEKAFWEYFLRDEKEITSLKLSLAVIESQQKRNTEYKDKDKDKDQTCNSGCCSKRPVWQDSLTQCSSIPESLKEYLEGKKHSSAALLSQKPITDSDKKAITIAVSELAKSGKIATHDLPKILDILEGYMELAGSIEKMRSKSYNAKLSSVHSSHSQIHSWASAAFWSADISPSLLNTNIEHIRKDQLAQLIIEAEKAAAALKPQLAHNPGMLRRKLALDYRKTLRESLSTFGEPFHLISSAKRRRLRRLITVCDVSGSVKNVTGLLMAFLYGLHQSFEGRIKHFVFVSEIDEITPYFSMGSYNECFDRIMQAAAVDYRGYSNYGNMLEKLWQRYRGMFDYETIVMFLGDARTNKYDPRVDIISEISRTVKKVFFLNPETRAKWYSGDSAVRQYEKVLEMIEISKFADLLRLLNKLPEMVVIA